MSYITFFRGIPGSGKTFYARKIQAITKCIIIDPDDIDILSEKFIEFKNKYPSTDRLKNIKYRFNLITALEALNRDINVIWTQPWRKESGLKITLENIYIKCTVPPNKITIIEFLTKPKVAWERSKNKLTHLTEDEFYKEYSNNQEELNISSIPIKVIDTNIPFDIEELIDFIV